MRKTIEKDASLRLFYHEKNLILEVWSGLETIHIELPALMENIKLEGNELTVIPKDRYVAMDAGVIQQRATPLVFILDSEERARRLMIAIMAGRSSSTDYSVTC
jgi:hypothetical protein